MIYSACTATSLLLPSLGQLFAGGCLECIWEGYSELQIGVKSFAGSVVAAAGEEHDIESSLEDKKTSLL